MHVALSTDIETFGYIFAIDDQFPYSVNESYLLATSFTEFAEIVEVDDHIWSLEEIQAHRQLLIDPLSNRKRE